MNILFVSNLYPNPYQEHRAPWNRQQVAALATHHNVRVISPLAWTDEMLWRRTQGDLLPRNRRVERGGIIADHPRYYFPPKLARGWYGTFYQKSIAKTFRQAVNEFKPDVVLAAWAYPDGLAAVRLARQHRLPCVVKVHGSDILLLNDFPARKRKTVEALQEASGIVAVSKHLVGAVQQLGICTAKTKVVYNGVNTTLFHPGSKSDARSHLSLKQDKQSILFVGNLVSVKRVDRLIAASTELRSRGIEFQLNIVGDGVLRQNLLAQAFKAGIQDAVTFHGSRPHGELPDWIRASDVVCLPSRSEGIPNVLLESAACRIPFVAFDIGGISEISHLGSSTILPRDESPQLADALEKHLVAAKEHKVGDGSSQSDSSDFRSYEDSAGELAEVLAQAINAA